MLGRGGMGKVYKVRIPVVGKISALKLLQPNPHLVSLLGKERIRERFISEAVTLAKLRHPNIVEILDFDEEAGNPFYLMDYYFNNLGTTIGETYRTEQPSRIIRMERAVAYTRQILSGLACLHHFGIIHRDIKPFNILMTAYDTVKICDFGLSKLRGETFGGPQNLKVGSPWYSAPEQSDDPDRVDASADLYSVGVMLYRMLTGNLPAAPYLPPSRFNPSLDWQWDRFIGQAISTNPYRRFPSASEMLEVLENLNAQWEADREKICQVYPVSLPREQKEPILHRMECLKVSAKDARETFAADELWRPITFIRNDFDPDPKSQTVADRATGLLWQQSGSDYPMNWRAARDYIEGLNRGRFGGRSNWRLPTVDELLSLVTEHPRGDFCIEPVFDRRQQWLWSCDRKSFIAAWYVSMDLGFVWWQDFSGFYSVRAVTRI